MKLPIVLDTCTILNLLRIDEDDEFLYKKLIKLNINICQKVFEEANKNINTKHFSNSQKKYISSHIPYFGTYILTCDERFESEYKAKIKQFCNYKKENGEFYSALISLYLCRNKNCRLYFYTDDHVTTTGKFRITDNVVAMDSLEDMLVPMTTVVNIYVLYRGDGILSDNIFEQFQPNFGGYAWTNIYSTDNNPITFIKPMNMIKSELTYKDPQIEGNQSGDCQISSIPFMGIECIEDDERFEYFISTFADQYNHLEDTVDYLQTSTHIDLKFYNTYGRSKNFIIGDEVDGESLIDTINITIKYYVWVNPNTDQIKAEQDLKQFIKDYIEEINSDGTNSFYNSNMMRTIENNYAYVHHIKFIGINHYDPKYQTVKKIRAELDTWT